MSDLTLRWSGRVVDKVPSPNGGARRSAQPLAVWFHCELRVQCQQKKNPFVAVAVDLAARSSVSVAVSRAASPVVTLATLAKSQRARGVSGPCGLWLRKPHRLRLSHPLLGGGSRATLARMSSISRLTPLARRLLTPRSSGRVIDKVPSSNVGARAAQLNR